MMSDITTSFLPHTPGKIIQAHHGITDLAEQGATKVLEKLLLTRPKEEARAKHIETKTIEPITWLSRFKHPEYARSLRFRVCSFY